MKKICFISPHTYPPWIEGVRNSVFGIAKELVKKGHEVHIITGNIGEDAKNNTKIDGVRITFLPKFSQKPSKILFNSCSHYSFLKKYVKQNKFDVIHLQTVDVTLILPLICLMHRTKAKKFITLYNIENIQHKIKKIFFSCTHKKFEKIITISPVIKSQMKKKYQKKTQVITVSYDKEKFDVDRKITDKEKFSSKTLLYTAGSKREEGVFTYLKTMKALPKYTGIFALYKLSKENTARRSNIIKYIKEMKIDNVKTLGTLENINDTMNKSTLFVMPLETHLVKLNVPLSVLEAMGTGTPVIASDIPSHREIIKNGVNGLLFSPGNPTDMMNKIKQITSDVKTYTTIRNKTIKYIKKWPSYKDVAKQHEEIYEKDK